MKQTTGSGIRSFIALSLPDSVRTGLHDIQSRLKSEVSGARWVRPESIHLTLKFLGDTPADLLDRIGADLQDWTRGVSGYTLHPRDMGAFPGFRRPRVLWIGFEDIPEPHHQLVDIFENALFRLGFPREQRRHRPHLTLARFRKPPGETNLESICRNTHLNLPAIPVNRITLYRSDLSPAGASYNPLFTVPLSEPQGG